MAKIAIYARKSVFREDSISIESQIELCKYETRGEDFLVYKDNGYSGKNTDRPDFQKMIEDIKSGIISKVIVYKLDRVSRSVLDFSELMDLFQKYNVDFVSATERFDTSSPMGRAMLNICIVFAQLERETIQQRVTDAYASRSKKGLYMGGKIPYGYKKVPTVIDGVKTSMYVQNDEEAKDVRFIYALYSEPYATLGDVLRKMKGEGVINNKRGKIWSTARLSELMRNPIYTTNDISMYYFFREQKSNLINPPEQFDGKTSLYLFSGDNCSRKTWDLSGQNVVIAPHEGIVSPDIWIACRKKLLSNRQLKTCKAKNSFLSGKVKCGYCGYAMVVRMSQRKDREIRYLIDTGWTEMHYCTHKLPTIRADEFEKTIVDRIKLKLDNLVIRSMLQNDKKTNEEKIRKIRARICNIENEIQTLISAITKNEANKITLDYVNSRINLLHNEKTSLNDEMEKLEIEAIRNSGTDYKVLRDVMTKWNDLSFDDKRSVVELLINKILVFSDKIEIQWKL